MLKLIGHVVDRRANFVIRLVRLNHCAHVHKQFAGSDTERYVFST